ncbi:patatin-like phospholipase family protein [Parabacteroides sp. FAFU027]|uniref:patatin-like phospholipase family protein n=1 Tax=Parabacteroides sp. FAFU027 TaxID=2922715 RepID=UPI001FAF8930|nr:patatin-like phospholipase family protein [Parabacteroides sp. FAFU027]
MNKKNTFRIGLSMAGAISAGAYTAGVIDYLLEALENWQKAKELNLPGVPMHNVIIEVINGASAGGMTAVITTAALQKNFPHINMQNYMSDLSKENPLYDSWVNLTDNREKDMMSQMLGIEDIENSKDINPDKEVRSLFNSLFIEQIARRTLDHTISDDTIKRPYIAPDYELFTTITNLRGYNYELEFKTSLGNKEDRMTVHKDIVHFQYNPFGAYHHNGRIPFHYNDSLGLNRNLLIDAAIATGAFPVGLSPRTVNRDAKYINDNPLLKMNNSKDGIINPDISYKAVCVDGGVINNEPYDLTEKILLRRQNDEAGKEATNKLDELKKQANTFDTTVLMIDPFPNYDDVPTKEYQERKSLRFAMPELINTMRQQLMVKSDLLAKAYDDDDFTRFMIVPVRYRNEEKEKYSIACGSFGGFGGFFSKKFRQHDYMLGRRNCQRFLQNYFGVPQEKNNPIIAYGYKNITGELLDLYLSDETKNLPIIPDIRIARDNIQLMKPAEEEGLSYPEIEVKYLLNLEDKAKKRFESIIGNFGNGIEAAKQNSHGQLFIQNYRKKPWFKKLFSRLMVNLFMLIGKPKVAGMIAQEFIDSVIVDMYNRGLVK